MTMRQGRHHRAPDDVDASGPLVCSHPQLHRWLAWLYAKDGLPPLQLTAPDYRIGRGGPWPQVL